MKLSTGCLALLALLMVPSALADVDRGIAEYEAENFEEAIAALAAVHGDNPSERSTYYLGLAYFELPDYDQAEPLVKKALGDTPRDPDLLYALATMQWADGRLETAEETAELLLAEEASARTHYLRGQIYQSQNAYSQAMAAYRQVGAGSDRRIAQRARIQMAQVRAAQGDAEGALEEARAGIALLPNSFEADQLRRVESNLETDVVEKLQWQIGYRVEYDDNVTLLPEDPGLVFGGDTNASDIRHTVFGDLVYRHDLSDRWQSFFEVHAFQNALEELDDFDTGRIQLVGGLGWSQGKFGVRLPVQVSQTWVDGDTFLQRAAFLPGVFFQPTSNQLAYFFTRYQESDFDLDFTQPVQNQDDDSLAFGGLYLLNFMEDRAQLRLIAETSDVDAEGANFDRDETRLYGYVTHEFIDNWTAGLGAQYLDADYDNFNTAFLTEREDDQTDWFATLAWQVSEHWRLRGQYGYSDRDSSIPVFAFDRSSVSFSVTYEN